MGSAGERTVKTFRRNSRCTINSTLISAGAHLSQVTTAEVIKDFYSVTMAPKKAKKAADSINSRLALVMKSGKGKSHNLFHT